MKTSDIEEVRDAMKRLERAIFNLARMAEYIHMEAGVVYLRPSKHTAAVKRASMDLTRALADLRKRG